MWIWLVVAVVAAIGELLSYDLFLGAVAAAALITGVLAVPIHVVALQVVVFAGLSLVGIAFVRPVVKRMLGIEGLAHDPGALPQTHLHGRRAVVTELVDASGGQIRIGEGEFWTARPFDLTRTHQPGEIVEVLMIDGVIALVEPSSLPKLDSRVADMAAPSEKGM